MIPLHATVRMVVVLRINSQVFHIVVGFALFCKIHDVYLSLTEFVGMGVRYLVASIKFKLLWCFEIVKTVRCEPINAVIIVAARGWWGLRD